MYKMPLKRHEALKNLSREHHDGLVFALRLQKGISKKADLKALEAYTDWFWKNYLHPHFQLEEQHLFPMCVESNDLVLKAKAQHGDIKSLIDTQPKTYQVLKSLYQHIQAHIRFEERVFFMRIQDQLSEEDLAKFHKIHSKQSECGLWLDRFWD
ncbi:MAG: hemerythrin domain-containing protein [Bacteroidetes bacterium]|uniref:Hemerythrin domain-containing protein n=2 Tax=Mesohalobacter halotolerans TaxID=1883405 RepID=A0A4U5TTF0_9FLAO|nr:hemerythrin domain-containing protein [Bacteroidota bacterium]TKS57649.1 hemerythrin domain-containing protein [Mesohalobacter halotolerans]